MATIDVRPLLARGQEPFAEIMAAVGRLKKGESLVLLAPFEPKPLYGAMASRGYGHSAQRGQDGSWTITFAPAGAAVAGKAQTDEAWVDTRLYRPFIYGALAIALTLGFTTGAAMLLLPLLGLTLGAALLAVIQSHGLAQVFGWGGLFVMGFAFHVVPRFTKVKIPYPLPQRLILGLVVVAIILRSAGQVFLGLGASPWLLVLSGILLLATVLLFAAVIAPPLARSAGRGLTEAWLGMSLVWAVAAAMLHMALVVYMASDGLVRSAPAGLDSAFIHLGMMGFLGSNVFGIGVHALTPFMSLQPGRRGVGWAAFGLMNIGVLCFTLAALLGLPAAWQAAAWTLESIAAVLFILALRIFEPRPAKRPYVPGTYARYEWYVRASFTWLVAGLGLEAFAAWDGALGTLVVPVSHALPVIHVLALGFITMAILGMAVRMLPIFEGAELPHHGLMDAAFWLLNASVALRLAFGVLPLPAAEAVLAASGAMGLLALVLFAIVVLQVLRPAAREAYHKRLTRIAQQRAPQTARREIPLRLG